MLKIKVGGVEEHFNMPWFLLQEAGHLEDEDIDLEWINCIGGTGEMTSKLRNGELDIAVLLTEGIVADIAKGNPSRILKVYVQSKLEWGIHTAYHSDLTRVDENPQSKYAISKFGSGSHLMAMLYAMQSGFQLSDTNFKEVGSLQGALKAFEDKSVDYFFWEKFTTEPYYDLQQLRRIDSIQTPWPCFVIAINPAYYINNREQIDVLVEQVFDQARKLKENANAVNILANRFNLSIRRVQKWFRSVEWGDGQNLSSDETQSVIDALKSLGSVNGMEMKKSDLLL